MLTMILKMTGLAVSSAVLQMITGEWRNPFKKVEDENVSLSQTFQRYLFIITYIVILGNFIFSYKEVRA